MRSFIAALRTLVLPYGALSGTRLVLDGVNGRIELYDATNTLVGYVDGDRAVFGDSTGARVELEDGAITIYDTGNDVVGQLDADFWRFTSPASLAEAGLYQAAASAGLFLLPPDPGGGVTLTDYGYVSGDTDNIGAGIERPRTIITSPQVDGEDIAWLYVEGETSDGAQLPRVTVGTGGNPVDLLVPNGDVKVLGASLGRGLVAGPTTGGASAALTPAGTLQSSFGVTVTNSDDVLDREYLAVIRCRFDMNGGANGLFRAVVADDVAAPAPLGTSLLQQQVFTNVVAGAGQVDGIGITHFELAPGASQDVAAAGLRVAGGSAGDTIVSASLFVLDVTGHP